VLGLCVLVAAVSARWSRPAAAAARRCRRPPFDNAGDAGSGLLSARPAAGRCCDGVPAAPRPCLARASALCAAASGLRCAVVAPVHEHRLRPWVLRRRLRRNGSSRACRRSAARVFGPSSTDPVRHRSEGNATRRRRVGAQRRTASESGPKC